MRLLGTFQDPQQAVQLSKLLAEEKIDNNLENVFNNDWGSSDYGSVIYRVWVINEEQVEKANHLYETFLKYGGAITLSKPPQELQPPPALKEKKPIRRQMRLAPSHPMTEPMGKLTLTLLILCCLIFGFKVLTTPPIPETIPKEVSPTPLFMAPLYKELMYDYPHTYELIDKLEKAYGLEKLQTPSELPPAGQILLTQIYHTPYWQGFYDILINHYQHPDSSWSINVPMFEKIKEGEVWRAVSPCLLHSDLFHLFFNMIWLAVIGRQIEEKLGIGRTLLFILITGAISNTAQYLMGGPNFIGFSGVLCAMVGFIWIRRKRAAWEGYQVQGSTITFLFAFILTMFAIQFISFFLETYQQISISPGIANTAHLAGAACGVILGRFDFFRRQNSG